MRPSYEPMLLFEPDRDFLISLGFKGFILFDGNEGIIIKGIPLKEIKRRAKEEWKKGKIVAVEVNNLKEQREVSKMYFVDIILNPIPDYVSFKFMASHEQVAAYSIKLLRDNFEEGIRIIKEGLDLARYTGVMIILTSCASCMEDLAPLRWYRALLKILGMEDMVEEILYRNPEIIYINAKIRKKYRVLPGGILVLEGKTSSS